MNRKLPQLLTDRLAEPLPGPMVGSRYESSPRWWRYDVTPPEARTAAVLILLYPHEDQWQLPLTLRPDHLPDHAGQISLPGGAIEPGETVRQAAIREFHEELGAEGHEIEILGELSPLYVHVSRFRVTPCVAVTETRPDMVPNPDEVAQLIEVPLAHLFDTSNLGSRQRQYEGRPYTAPHFAWQSHNIWGATCMILGELVTVLEDVCV